MTWIIHKGFRDRMVNLESFDECHQQQASIILIRGETLRLLEFNTEKEAKQAWGYLMEAVKRKDTLVHL